MNPANDTRKLDFHPATILVLAVLLVELSACGSQTVSPGNLKNMKYGGVYEDLVLLENGVYEGPSFVEGGGSRPRVALVTRLQINGDLNDDGINETVVFLVENSGGSGTATYLALVGGRGGQLENIDTVLLGDRIQVRSLKIDAADLIVEIVATGKNEPLCCGTTHRQLRFRFENSSLVWTADVERGNLSLTDLERVDWRLMEFATDDPVPDGVEITAVFAEGRISGSSGCNRYFATIENTEPYNFSTGMPAGTRMLCPGPAMEIEMRFLSLLQKSKQFGFSFGDLVLYYQDGDEFGQLRFTHQTDPVAR